MKPLMIAAITALVLSGCERAPTRIETKSEIKREVSISRPTLEAQREMQADRLAAQRRLQAERIEAQRQREADRRLHCWQEGRRYCP